MSPVPDEHLVPTIAWNHLYSMNVIANALLERSRMTLIGLMSTTFSYGTVRFAFENDSRSGAYVDAQHVRAVVTASDNTQA